MDALENQDYTFEDLVKKTVPTPDHSRNPIFDVVLAVQNMEFLDMEAGGVTLSLNDYVHQVAKFDLGFYVYERQQQLLVRVEYNTKIFRAETIDLFMRNFNEIIDTVLDNPDILLNDIQISNDLLTAQADESEIDLGF